MKQTSLLAVLASVALLGFAVPASAQWVVVDPTNLVQNIMTAANTLKQIDNQVLQLANEAQMLSNEAKNLQNLNFNDLSRLQATLNATRLLLAQVQGITFQLSQTQAAFARLYPSAYGASFTRAQLASDALERWNDSHGALGVALNVQAQATQNFASDEGVLADLVGRSQSAAGALQALQATNQLLALQARQAIQGQQLAITRGRTEGLEQGRALEAEARSRELRRRFMSSATRYTPETVAGF
jgi:type IV secretion system protein TrbJ